MQSKDMTSIVIRLLRKKETKTKTAIAEELGVSYPTVEKIIKDLINCGAFQKADREKLIPSPDYESFAGVYISADTVELSIIDFSGKEIHHVSKKFDLSSYFNSLLEILKLEHPSNIKALSICSEDFEDRGESSKKYNNYLFIKDKTMKEFIPKGMSFYGEKICEANSLKYYDDNEDEELNVIFSFFENTCQYTIMKNGTIIQKRRAHTNIKETEEFYKDVVFPVWQIINPDKMIFIVSNEEIFNLLNNKISEWKENITVYNEPINAGFDSREPTELIVNKQIHPSESAAIHALYRYYGWTD